MTMLVAEIAVQQEQSLPLINGHRVGFGRVPKFDSTKKVEKNLKVDISKSKPFRYALTESSVPGRFQ